MSVASIVERAGGADPSVLEAMVGPDTHRPGRARYRLVVEHVPIWAIIGHIKAIGGTTEPDAIGSETVAAVARERGLPEIAIVAALHYYVGNRCPIDALLEANAAALE